MAKCENGRQQADFVIERMSRIVICALQNPSSILAPIRVFTVGENDDATPSISPARAWPARCNIRNQSLAA
jgi:hypothetical protein